MGSALEISSRGMAEATETSKEIGHRSAVSARGFEITAGYLTLQGFVACGS